MNGNRFGFALALVTGPPVVFWPIFALMANCPPQYGRPLMRAIVIAFVICEIIGIRLFLRIRKTRRNWAGLASVAAIVVAACVIIGLIALLSWDIILTSRQWQSSVVFGKRL